MEQMPSLITISTVLVVMKYIMRSQFFMESGTSALIHPLTINIAMLRGNMVYGEVGIERRAG